MPGEIINPLCPQPAPGNLCECGPRLFLRHSRPKPFSRERAPGPQLEPAALVGAAEACSAPHPPGAWVEDAAASRERTMHRGLQRPGPLGPARALVRISPCPDVLLAFG